MRFVYVGNELETTAFGLIFTKGVSVEVEDAGAIKKLTNNGQFLAEYQITPNNSSANSVAEEVAPPKGFFKQRGRPKGK